MRRRLAAITVAAVAAGAAGASDAVAQNQPITVGSELEDYVRTLQLDGLARPAPFVIRSFSANATAGLTADSAHLWDRRYPLVQEPGDRRTDGPILQVIPIDPQARTIYNTAYPRGANDGAIWAGKGATGSVSGGVVVQWGPVTGTLFPTIYYAENRDFPIVPVSDTSISEFAYPWHDGKIDWPQRFGNEALTEFDWGQSGIRLDLGAFTTGVSNENLWWGPALRNSMIMSNAGPGFAHFDLGTGRPVWIGIGHIEVRAVYGRLVESTYFDMIASNSARFMTGLTASYQPRWFPGLVLGGSRVLYERWPDDGIDPGDIFLPFGKIFRESERLPDGTEIQDSTDQLVSVFARWVFPKSGFEAYVEWARNDFSGGLRDFLQEPDHSQAYTVGFQKTLRSGKGRLRFRGEVTHLGRSQTFQVRATPTYYVHNIVRAGYTHRGQLLGAWIGPGSDSQFFGVDRYDRNGRIGAFIQRHRRDDDAYYINFGPILTRNGHDVELTAGISALRFIGEFDVLASLALSRELNRYFQVRPERNDVTNLNAQVSVRWKIR